MIYIYHLINLLLFPVFLIILVFRIINKKEDLKRIVERFGITRLKRPQGDQLVWFHAASVGESVIALNLIDNISKLAPHLNFLITSGTLTSAKIIQQQSSANIIHQFLPLDNLICIKIFLKRWRPTLGIFIEAEIWPCLIYEAAKNCRLLLVNARMTDRSFKRWNKAHSFFKGVMANFVKIITQSTQDYDKYLALGADNLINVGNVKLANKKLSFDTTKLEELKKHLINRKIVTLASTHASDESIIFEIIKPLKKIHPECYFIAILRHPNRNSTVANDCLTANLSYSFSSQNHLPKLDDDLYIVDEFGQLGLYYDLAEIAFIGGSFSEGGHNPIEAAHFENLILFGPDMSKCRELADDLLNATAALQINNSQELLKLLDYFLSQQGADELKSFQRNALQFIDKHHQVYTTYLSIIRQYINV